MVRYKVCPQCGVRRFRALDQSGDFVKVAVTRDGVLDFDVAVVLSVDEADLILHCLGCSWKGTKNRLVNYFGA